MIIAYLIPIFPMPSQTFIRRELAALESRGWTIHRFAMRRFDGGPADPADQVEQDRTRYILDAGARGLISTLVIEMFSRPRCFLAALSIAVRMGLRSEKGVVRNLIYLAEACFLRRRLAECSASICTLTLAQIPPPSQCYAVSWVVPRLVLPSTAPKSSMHH